MQNPSYTSTDKMLGHHHETYCSLSPILIGGLIGLGLGFLMDLFSVSMGLSLFTTDSAGARMLAMSGAIGMLIGTIITMYVTGFVAGYLSAPSCSRKNVGMIYGFSAWCLSLILIVLLGAAISNYMTGYAGSMTSPRAMAARDQVQLTAQENTRAASDTMLTVSGDNAHDTTRAERDVKAAGMQSFIIFVLFLAGGISAAMGGHVGYRCWFKHKNHHNHH